jgi:hypothetical protein
MTLREQSSPLSRDAVEVAGPALRALLGLAFIAFSAGATVTIGGDDLRRWLGDAATLGLFPDRFWLASMMAVGLSVGEILTRGKRSIVYGGLLLVDSFYTSRQIQLGFQRWLIDLGVLAEPGALLPVVHASPGQIALSWALALVVGIFIARWGEELVFGKPKARPTRKAE